MKKTILLLSLGSLVFTACQKELSVKEEVGIKQVENADELVISSNFDWKMTKTVELNLSSHSNAVVQVLGANGQTVNKAYVPAEKIHSVQLTIPAHQKEVKVKYGRKSYTVPVEGKTVNYRQH